MHQGTAIPGLIYLPVAIFCGNSLRFPMAETPISETVSAYSPERASNMPVYRISRRSPMQSFHSWHVMMVPSPVIVIIIKAVVIARAQCAPRNPGGSIIEGNKSGRPEVEGKGRPRQPAPPVPYTAVPPPVMIREPSPGFIRNPGPTPSGTIAPATHRVGGPGYSNGKRNPGCTVRFHRYPSTVPIQIGGADIDIIWNMLSAVPGNVINIAAIGPLIPAIPLAVM